MPESELNREILCRPKVISGIEQSGCPIVQGQHALPTGFGPPEVDHFAEFLRPFSRRIVSLGKILIQVIQLVLLDRQSPLLTADVFGSGHSQNLCSPDLPCLEFDQRFVCIS